jgi:aminopeptidase N
MEHQSSVTYGNGFANGYRGRDLSGTGVGLKFDFIVVHESAHEWFGNNISMKDAADMWIHESFANYAENLFVEYHFTKEAAEDYVMGCRKLINNDSTIIGTYDVNKSGSGDMYYKGGNMLHTMRHVLNDDEKWRSVMLGLNQEFWHKTVTTAEFEAYFNRKSGFDFSLFFDQYLRTTDIPVLKYATRGKELTVWWENAVPGFSVPVLVRINGKERRITVSDQRKSITLGAELKSFELDRNFYMAVAAEE